MSSGMLPGLEAYAARDLSLGQWDTDPILARALVRWAGVEGKSVLEPSAGIGNVAIAALEAGAASVRAVEVDPLRADLLRLRLADWIRRGQRAAPRPSWCGDPRSCNPEHCDDCRPSVSVAVADFLSLSPPDRLLDVSVGNPPFENLGELTHATHAARHAARVCFILRLESLGSTAREAMWAGLRLSRLGVLVPRPPFGGEGNGMHEIAFVELSRRWDGPSSVNEAVRLEWVRWRELGAPVSDGGRA